MTTGQMVIKNRREVLKLAQTVGNDAEASRGKGYSRDGCHRFEEFYDIDDRPEIGYQFTRLCRYARHDMDEPENQQTRK